MLSFRSPSLVVAALVLASLALPGCRSLGTGAGTGAVIGTAVGTAAGYAIGRHNGETWRGAGIGAVTGGLLGAAIGDAVEPDRRAHEIEGPAVYRTEGAPSPRLPEHGYERGYERVTVTRSVPPPPPRPAVRDRVIVRDIYPDGTVRERTVIVE